MTYTVWKSGAGTGTTTFHVGAWYRSEDHYSASSDDPLAIQVARAAAEERRVELTRKARSQERRAAAGRRSRRPSSPERSAPGATR